ncbi:hypothetical protein uan_092 [Pseudomonas phage UAntarctica]|nr:hypothetical protein uan_092 [Pseudomonas phage UAntarctica]
MWLTDWLFNKKDEPPGWAQDFMQNLEAPVAPPVLRMPECPEPSQPLLAELEKYKRLYKDSQYNEQLLARRIGEFKKDWPDIHKRYFTSQGEQQRAAGIKSPPVSRKRK